MKWSVKNIEMVSIYIDWSVLKIAVDVYEMVSLFAVSSSKKIWFISVEKRNLVSKNRFLISRKNILSV